MSGQFRGKIEMAIAAGNRSAQAQVAFKGLYDFFSSHPNYSVIALQYGLTGTNVPGSTTSGLGTGYFDGANSFGYNAFFVVKAIATTLRPFDVYYLIQYGGSSTSAAAGVFGSSPGNPGKILGVAGTGLQVAHIGIQCAIGIGGSGNPWKGTANANGADTKATLGPVWSAPTGGGTGVIIFPRSNCGQKGNGAVGSFVSLTENCGAVLVTAQADSANAFRMNIVGDDDSFFIFTDGADTGVYNTIVYCGLYTPRANVYQTNSYPFCSIMDYNNAGVLTFTAADNGVYGDLVGTSTRQGGIVNTLSGTTCGLQLDHLANNFMTDANFWPDHQMPGAPYNEFPISVGLFENNPIQLSGYLGQIEWIREAYGIVTNNTKSDFSRIFIGNATTNASKLSVPWDAQNSTVPRSGATRAGTTFVTSI